jgi:hypothetical protein
MKEEIPTSEYMVDGWDRGPIGCHPYKRGSFHNKLGMWIMFIFYGIVIVQVIHAMTVIPFFPITFTILSGLFFIWYVAWRAT